MFANDLETAEQLLDLLPPDPGFITIHEMLYCGLLKERFGFGGMHPCWQFGWLRPTPPPLPDLDAEIRQLDVSHLSTVSANYQMEGEEYLRQLIEQDKLYGVFDSGTLMAFAGCHAEGSIGLLEVLPQYRRRGLATLLQSHMIRLELSRGHVPYGQVFDGNGPSLALQQSLGMTQSTGQLYWATRDD